MNPLSTIPKRLLVAASLVLVTACGSNGITEPSAKKSGYLTVSAAVRASGYNVPAGITPNSGYNVPAGITVNSGYNVAAKTVKASTTTPVPTY